MELQVLETNEVKHIPHSVLLNSNQEENIIVKNQDYVPNSENRIG